MYSYIGEFEKKFKSILFSEICEKYICGDSDNNDKYCISYIKEINDFLMMIKQSYLDFVLILNIHFLKKVMLKIILDLIRRKIYYYILNKLVQEKKMMVQN